MTRVGITFEGSATLEAHEPEDVSGRSLDTFYQNNTGHPIFAIVKVSREASFYVEGEIEGLHQDGWESGTAYISGTRAGAGDDPDAFTKYSTVTAIIPDNWEYQVYINYSGNAGAQAVEEWHEQELV